MRTWAKRSLHSTAGMLFILFVILFMFDAWLSLQFIAVDPELEANGIIKYLIARTGYPPILYFLKAAVLMFVGILFFLYERKHPGRTIILSALLVILLASVNATSINMLVELKRDHTEQLGEWLETSPAE